MKNVFIGLLILICPQLAISSTSQIIETDKLETIKSYIKPESWVLVDLDFTLFEAAEEYCHADWFYHRLNVGLEAGKKKDDIIREFYPEWIQKQRNCKVKLIESESLRILTELQNRGNWVIGFTHRQEPIADFTISQVKSLGFEFSNGNSPKGSWKSNTPRCPILYKNGILFACDYNSKGEVWTKFTREFLHENPKHIIFIDDGRANVESIAAVMKKQSIPYLGIFYTAYKNRKK